MRLFAIAAALVGSLLFAGAAQAGPAAGAQGGVLPLLGETQPIKVHSVCGYSRGYRVCVRHSHRRKVRRIVRKRSRCHRHGNQFSHCHYHSKRHRHRIKIY